MRISDWSSDVCSSDLIRDRYELEAGLRYDYKSLDALGYDRELRLYGGTRQFHTVSASLGGVWRPAQGWDFRSNLGMARRPPSVQHGRASCRECVCPDVELPEIAESIKQRTNKH